MEYVILSNNSSLGAEFQGYAVLGVAGGLKEIYEAMGARLQQGYALISSPLPANVPLIRSPIRSVILEKTERRYDAGGLMVLEKARERTQVLGVLDEARTRPDLELIDRDQLQRAIAQLEALNSS